jgi:hypothetical protein
MELSEDRWILITLLLVVITGIVGCVLVINWAFATDPFICENGDRLSFEKVLDDTTDCSDGSDEFTSDSGDRTSAELFSQEENDAFVECCLYWFCGIPLLVIIYGSVSSQLNVNWSENISITQTTETCQRFFCNEIPYGECPNCGIKYCESHATRSVDSPWPKSKFGTPLPNPIWPCRFCYDREKKKDKFNALSTTEFNSYLLNSLSGNSDLNYAVESPTLNSVNKKDVLSSSNDSPVGLIGFAVRVIALPFVIIGGIFFLRNSDYDKGFP